MRPDDLIMEDVTIDELEAMLLEKNDVDARNSYGRTLLMDAAIYNRIDVAKILLTKGAAIDAACSRLGSSALHFAAEKLHAQMCELLIQNDAPIDATDVYGNRPLSKAIFSSKAENDCVKILLKNGANLDAKNKFGRSARDLVHLVANYDLSWVLAE